MILDSQRRNFVLEFESAAAAFQLRGFEFTHAQELTVFPNPRVGIIRSDAARMILN